MLARTFFLTNPECPGGVEPPVVRGQLRLVTISCAGDTAIHLEMFDARVPGRDRTPAIGNG